MFDSLANKYKIALNNILHGHAEEQDVLVMQELVSIHTEKKKPVLSQKEFEHDFHYRCPHCDVKIDKEVQAFQWGWVLITDGKVTSKTVLRGYSHCPHCGQLLDLSELEEHEEY